MSFSWRRAIGLSAAKGRLSRAIGIPLTASGRRKKFGSSNALFGCLGMMLIMGLGVMVLCGGLIGLPSKQQMVAQHSVNRPAPTHKSPQEKRDEEFKTLEQRNHLHTIDSEPAKEKPDYPILRDEPLNSKPGEWRTWKHTVLWNKKVLNGPAYEAKFLKLVDGRIVHLEKRDGEIVKVPLKNFTHGCQQWIQKHKND